MDQKADRADAMAFVDSHTEGEPTRVVLDGLPPDLLAPTPIRARARLLAQDHPKLRAAIVDEPRGYPALVGALLLPASAPEADAAVLFINNAGQLPMCVHASIGIAQTLVHLGRRPATPWATPFVLETPAGLVRLRLEAGDVIAVENVPARRIHAGLTIETSLGPVRVDVAWGGNWFLIVEDPPLAIVADNLPALHAFTRELRIAGEAMGLRGDDGAAIDHVQLCGPSEAADSRNFVLCPGGEHDRSPCGTGTSARLAGLFADGRLAPGQRWRQEGIGGTCFIGSVEVLADRQVRPTIRGRAFVTSEGRLRFDPRDSIAGLAIAGLGSRT